MNTYNNRSNGTRKTLLPAAIPVMALEELHHALMDRQTEDRASQGKPGHARRLKVGPLVLMASVMSALVLIQAILH